MGVRDLFLGQLLAEHTQRLFEKLIASKAYTEILDLAYAQAHRSSVLYNLLRLSGKQPKQFRNRTLTDSLERQALDEDLAISITNQYVQYKTQRQADAAARILTAHKEAGGPMAAGAEARAASYAGRWSINQGVADVAERSKVFVGGQPGQVYKTWVRLKARAEKRAHHTALEGLTIPYSEYFRLETPKGTFMVLRPYDDTLPSSETFNCGHAIQLSLPKNAEVDLWDGS